MERSRNLLDALRASRLDYPNELWIAQGIAMLDPELGTWGIRLERDELVFRPHISPHEMPLAFSASNDAYRFAVRIVHYFPAPAPEEQWLEWAMLRAPARIIGEVLYPDPRRDPDRTAQATKARVAIRRQLEKIMSRDTSSAARYLDVEGSERMTAMALEFMRAAGA